jgi:hypothetical protein
MYEGENQMTQLKTTTCRNHTWRPAFKRRQCRLCIGQTEMRARWKKIRQAFRIVSRCARRPSPTAVPVSPAEVRRQRSGSGAADHQDRLVVISVLLHVFPLKST